MSGRGFVEMTREETTVLMNRWHEIKTKDWSAMPEIFELFDKLVSNQIMLLRAIEEVEARPWWKPRRHNPYAH
jgi:hypothetical protein